MTKSSKSSAAEHVEMEGFEGHYAELGGYTVGLESYTQDADLTPLFAGLPDDRCRASTGGTSSRAGWSSTPRQATRSSWQETRTSWGPATPR